MDVDAWIGHWPFQSLPCRQAKDLLRKMDHYDIDKAMVGNLNGCLYKDVHESNHELMVQIKGKRDRLLPCALIDPNYDGWREDLRQCREEFGMSILRLLPDYHGYDLESDLSKELVNHAHELGFRVALVGRMVDPRGRHRLDPGRESNLGNVASFLDSFPDHSFLMLNFPSILDRNDRSAPCLYDIPRFVGENGLRLGREIRRWGASRFCLGTTFLLRYGMPSLLALERCELDPRDREAIEWRNVERFLPKEACS